jgi:hypothetical protein
VRAVGLESTPTLAVWRVLETGVRASVAAQAVGTPTSPRARIRHRVVAARPPRILRIPTMANASATVLTLQIAWALLFVSLSSGAHRTERCGPRRSVVCRPDPLATRRLGVPRIWAAFNATAMTARKALHKRERLELFRSELVSSNATTCYKSAMEDFHQDNKKQLPASCLGLEKVPRTSVRMRVFSPSFAKVKGFGTFP